MSLSPVLLLVDSVFPFLFIFLRDLASLHFATIYFAANFKSLNCYFGSVTVAVFWLFEFLAGALGEFFVNMLLLSWGYERECLSNYKWFNPYSYCWHSFEIFTVKFYVLYYLLTIALNSDKFLVDFGDWILNWSLSVKKLLMLAVEFLVVCCML